MTQLNGAYGRLTANPHNGYGYADTTDYGRMLIEMSGEDSMRDDLSELTEALDMMAGRTRVGRSVGAVVLEESASGAPPLSSLGCPCPDARCLMK